MYMPRYARSDMIKNILKLKQQNENNISLDIMKKNNSCDITVFPFIYENLIVLPVKDKNRKQLLFELGLDQSPELSTKSIMIIDRNTDKLIGGIAISTKLESNGKLYKIIRIIDNSNIDKIKLILSKILLHPGNEYFQDAMVTSSNFRSTTFMQPEHERNGKDEYNNDCGFEDQETFFIST